jgi:hypothetical protein
MALAGCIFKRVHPLETYYLLTVRWWEVRSIIPRTLSTIRKTQNLLKQVYGNKRIGQELGFEVASVILAEILW